MAKHPPTTVFFDLDETLIYNQYKADELFSDLFRAHLSDINETLTESFIKTLFSKVEPVWDNLFDRQQTPEQKILACFTDAAVSVGGNPASAVALFDDFIHRSSSCTVLINNSLETLAQIKDRGIAIGIITNGIEAMQWPKIKKHGIDKMVDHVIISEHAGAHKPSHRVFDYALEKLNTPANQAWHVGDHVDNDIAGAINNGMKGVFFDPENQGVEKSFAEIKIRPDFVINDLADIITLLD